MSCCLSAPVCPIVPTICRSSSPSVAASRAPSVLGAALSAVAAAATSGLPSAGPPASGTMQAAAEPHQADAAAAPGAGSSNGHVQPLKQQGKQRGPRGLAGRSSPVAIPGKAANGSDAAAADSGSGGGVEAALSNFGNVMTGWGRNLLGAGVVDSLSSNEGIKALVSGTGCFLLHTVHSLSVVPCPTAGMDWFALKFACIPC